MRGDAEYAEVEMGGFGGGGRKGKGELICERRRGREWDGMRWLIGWHCWR